MLTNTAKLIRAAEPKNYTGAAVTKKWVNMKNYRKLAIEIVTGAWASGATAAVTVKQATDSSGTGSKAVSFSYQWNDETASDTLVETAVTSNTFDLTTANKLYVIEIDVNDLDVNNGFNYVSVDVASPGSNACFYGAKYTLYDGRYEQETPPSIA